MLNREFIPYEQALVLKELGFDEPCFGYYQQEWHDDGMTELEPSLQMIVSKQHQHAFQLCTAPTFSQAFRWFRENHNLDSWIYCSDENKGYFAIIVSCKRLVFYNENKNTYEEAELACLKKLIEIVKNK